MIGIYDFRNESVHVNSFLQDHGQDNESYVQREKHFARHFIALHRDI